MQLITQINVNLHSEQPKLPELLGNVTALYKTVLKCFIKQDQYANESDVGSIIISNPHNFKALNELYLGANFEVLEKTVMFR